MGVIQRNQPVLVMVLAALASGCATEPIPDNSIVELETDGPDGDAMATVTDPMPIRQELLNRTYRYPRLGSGSQANDSIQVPRGAQQLLVHTRAVPECPYAYQNGARLILLGPNGNETNVYLFGLTSTISSMACGRDHNRSVEVAVDAPGEWRVKTGGEMMGSADVVLIAAGLIKASSMANEERRELHNQTYTYPRLGMGLPPKDTFDVPVQVEGLELLWQAVPDCPLAITRNPEFVLRDPSGLESTYKVYPRTANGTIGVDGCGVRPIFNAAPRMIAGTWYLEGRGEFQGSVRVVLNGVYSS